jgi:hypothetical protein
MDSQCIWLDAGGMLPVISEPSSDVRQAATPKNAVSIKDATSKIIEEKWLTPWPRNPHSMVKERARSAESENAAGLT